MIKEPGEIVSQYYHALYSGDLTTVKALMVEKSYLMTLESFGLRLSFKDKEFKSLLAEIEENPASMLKVEALLSKELISRDKTPKIQINKIEANGSRRKTVHYTEDGKVKKLYFSKEESGWKIDYYAGRKVD